jgi:hypothetical protein
MNTAIVPVAVYPATANTLLIRSISLGPPPAYYYELQEVTVVPGTPAVPGTTEQLDPTTGEVIVPATPEIPATPDTTTVVVLKNGNVSMTIDQWDNWAAGPESEDDDYQLNCISANLGLTRA